MNYVDIIILGFIALFMYIGYLRGFIRDFTNLLALLGSLFLATYTYSAVGAWLAKVVSLPVGLAGTVAFFSVWAVSMFVYYAFMIFFYDRIPENIRESRYNKWLGLIPALVTSVFFVWVVINLLSLLVVSGPLQSILDHSYFSKKLTGNNTVVSNFVSKTFGPAMNDAAKFMTVTPQSNESIELGYSTANVVPDNKSAQEMLVLLNKERKDRGLKELVFDDKLAKVGEDHCRDMFARGYFSHNTPDGKTPFDRMNEAGINYLIAGENLALAPTLDEAFTGLMNSPGHKANMLSSDFGRMGVGVIDGGVYGKMFAQEFTN